MTWKGLADQLESKGHDIVTGAGRDRSQRDAGVEDPRTSWSAAGGFSPAGGNETLRKAQDGAGGETQVIERGSYTAK